MPDNLWGELAQMGERRPCKAEVAGSNPAFSIVKILDGNCIEASERRLKVLREVQGGALPGKSLVVYEPAHGLVTRCLSL